MCELWARWSKCSGPRSASWAALTRGWVLLFCYGLIPYNTIPISSRAHGWSWKWTSATRTTRTSLDEVATTLSALWTTPTPTSTSPTRTAPIPRRSPTRCRCAAVWRAWSGPGPSSGSPPRCSSPSRCPWWDPASRSPTTRHPTSRWSRPSSMCRWVRLQLTLIEYYFHFNLLGKINSVMSQNWNRFHLVCHKDISLTSYPVVILRI